MKPEAKVSLQNDRAGDWDSAGTHHAGMWFLLFIHLLLASLGRKLGLMRFQSDRSHFFALLYLQNMCQIQYEELLHEIKV